MNCQGCKENLYNLFDTKKVDLTKEMKQHLHQCDDCYKEYKQIKDIIELLKSGNIKAPLDLKNNIISVINKKTAISKLQASYKLIIGIAAALVLVLVIPFIGKNNSNAAEARGLFQNAIEAIESVKSMFIAMDVRTEPTENFAFIDVRGELTPHNIYQQFGKDRKWRIDKVGRVAVMKNDCTFLWIPLIKYAGVVRGESDGIIDWFSLLLNPSNILRIEKEQAESKRAEIKIEQKGNDILLNIISKAEGNFINNVGKNSSIRESDNRREYVFDKQTNLLKSLKIFILQNNIEILVLNVRNVQYNISLEEHLFDIHLPDQIKWSPIIYPRANEKNSSSSVKEIARIALKDMSQADFKTHASIWQGYNFLSLQLISHYYKGLAILHIGEPFQSGLYAGYFVPYKIKLKNGRIKDFRLAIRNDNPDKVWLVDGGL